MLRFARNDVKHLSPLTSHLSPSMNSTFINGLAEHIKSNYNLKNEELTVVFPNKRAAFYLRSRFKEIYDEDIWLPQMLSIQEAVTQWSDIQLVDSIDMLFELISINAELYHAETDLSLFGSMAVQMAKDFDEIDQYNVDANHLFSYVYEEKKIGTWRLDEAVTLKEQQYLEFFKSLQQYYEKLRERLDNQGKGYYGMITRKLASLDDEELLRRVKHRKVVFAGFNALTPTEQRIIDKLYRNGLAEVVWDFDRYYVDDPQNEAGLFARRYIANNVPWKPTVFSDSLLTDTKEIHLVGVTGNTIQSKALQSLLQVELKNDIAVVLADENLMIPVLNAIPNEPRYSAVKVSMGYPLRQTSLSHLVSAYFTLRRKGRQVKDKGWYLWPILRILDLELIKVVFNNQEISELDAYKTHILKKSIFIFQTTDFEQYCQSEDLRQFMKLLLESSLTALLAFIANKLQASDDDNAKLFLLNQISETGKAINRLKDILERHQHDVNSLEEWEILYRLVSSNTSIKLNSSSTDGLQLMGLLEARNLDFDTFYMIGVNEGVLPTDKSNASFIPYHIRKECHLPDYQEKQAVYAYHFYRQLQGANRMYFIYNASGAESGGEPSRFLLQLKYELAKRNPKIELSEETFSNRTEKPLAPDLLVVHKNNEVMEQLLQKVQTDNPRYALAPTSLSAFIQCPMRFFLKYIMRIEDLHLEEETQNNVIGSIVHNTLEKLYINYRNTLINNDLFINKIKSSLAYYLQETIATTFGQGLPDVGYNYLNQLTLDKLFANFLKHEEADLQRHELCILDVECTLHTKLIVNGIDCTIAGKADRIDRQDGIVRIIDYKTGILRDNEVKVPSQIESVANIPEKAMQLLIYKYLYLKEHPDVKPETVTAALFGLKNQRICFDLKIEHPDLANNFVTTMDQLLIQALTGLLDPNQPFTQPQGTKVKPCHFCDFKGICSNTVTGAQLADGR